MAKTSWLIKVGILLLIIGASFLACTFYRSGSTYSFAYGLLQFFPMKPDSWTPDNTLGPASTHFWAPRTLRLEIKTNATLDVYLLDSQGIQKWFNEDKLEPLATFEGTQQQIVTIELPQRGNYALLIHNPTSDSANYELDGTLYSYEKDLLWTGIAAIIAGFLILAASLALTWRANKK
jgi:hypothetical protein